MTPLGAELRNIRRGLGLTLKDHAQRVGISPAYLSALEHGHRSAPTREMLKRITSALELDTEMTQQIHGLREVSRPDVTIRTGGLPPSATELANLLAQNIHHLSSDELGMCVDMLRQKVESAGANGSMQQTARS